MYQRLSHVPIERVYRIENGFDAIVVSSALDDFL